FYKMINGNRIRQAREMRGLTQTALAEYIGIKQPAIAQMEAGEISPSAEVLQKIAIKTEFPVSFFKQLDSPEFAKGSMLFRARASLTKKESIEARQYARVIYEFAEKMEESFNKVAANVPRVNGNPTNAANEVRSYSGLSKDEPIPNLISVLEKNGIMILALPTCYENQDAFSAWVARDNKRPIIVISNHNVSGDRLRFSMAHELGHLMLHQELSVGMPKADKEANAFASEFLIPQESMLNELRPPVTLASLLSLKKRWLVSIQAIIIKAHDLKIISDRQYKYLMMQWHRKTEPILVMAERPRLLSQMAENIYGNPIDYNKIAFQMNLPPEIVKRTLEKYKFKSKIDTELSVDMGQIFKFEAKNKNQS
ncbi:MAG: XRE family transcriptional regulator, partial [Candidatus Omnitrophota bacterium]